MYIYRSCLLVLLMFLTGCDFANPEAAQALTSSQCETGKLCRYPNGVKVWLSDESLSPETPFTIFAELPAGFLIKDAKLEGVTMYMGYIPQQFKRQGHVWQSKTMVGICAEQNMQWKLVLNVVDTTEQHSQTLYYSFYVRY
jgi:hypothetical protein